MTIENICNQALDEIGYPRHIGYIYEGTKAARAFLNTWVQTRDALFEKVQPDWAKRDATLNLLRTAPNIVNGTANYDTGVWTDDYPPLPWLYEYEYPEDCLVPLQIKGQRLFLPVWRPRFHANRVTYEITGSKRAILSNVKSAILIYVASVRDPDNWERQFTELMIMALAKKLEPELAPERAMRRRQEQQQQGQQQDANAAG